MFVLHGLAAWVSNGNARYMWGKGLTYNAQSIASHSVASSRALMYPKGYNYAYRLPI